MGDLTDILGDTSGVKATNMDYEPLPAGRYLAAITSAELVPTSNGTGLMVVATFTIFEEEYAGRTIRHRFNIKNDSEKAQNIGRGMLKSCAIASGLSDIPNDTSDLLDRPVVINVKIREAQGEYGPSNEITGFYPKDAPTKKAAPAKATPTTKAAEPDDLPDFLS